MGTSYADFLAALRMRESSSNYQVVNTLGFLGAYQFGEGALVDLGFVRNDGAYWNNDYSGGWTGLLGIDSKAEFLASKAAQDAAADMWMKLLWRYLTAVGADDYLGRVVDGIRITASGLIAGAHLLGAGRVIDWLDSGGTLALKDAYGTPISEYIGMFSGYEMPFETGDITLADLADHLAGLADAVLDRIEAAFDSGGSLILGDDRDDTLVGAGKSDVIAGGAGNDHLSGGKGGDALIGGVGHDEIVAGAHADLATGGLGNDRLLGKTGKDLLHGDAGDDSLFGGAGNDRLFGGDGQDLLGGFLGNDRLFGGEGDDILRGGAGSDLLSGGAGADQLEGGDGADTFVFADGFGADAIADFSRKDGDRIKLAGVAGIDDFSDLTTAHAAQVGTDVVITSNSGDTLTLAGVMLDALRAEDFLF